MSVTFLVFKTNYSESTLQKFIPLSHFFTENLKYKTHFCLLFIKSTDQIFTYVIFRIFKLYSFMRIQKIQLIHLSSPPLLLWKIVKSIFSVF